VELSQNLSFWISGKANLRGLRGTCGYVGHRRSQSAWPAQHFLPLLIKNPSQMDMEASKLEPNV